MKITRAIERIKNKLKGNPDEVVIEPTNYCNLKCPICIGGRNLMTDEGGYMSLRLFQKLISEIKGKTYRILFSGRGEPSLHPEFDKMARICTEMGVFSHANSNGTLLNKPNIAERIVKSGLNRINIGLDGLTQDTYERIRKGGKLADVIGGIRRLAEIREKYHTKTPQIRINFIVTKHNHYELPKLESLASYMPVDKVQANLVCIPPWMLKDEKKYFELIDEFVPRNAPHRYENFKVIKPKKRCGEYYRLNIQWTGEIQPCFHHPFRPVELGNVFRSGVFNAWNSEELKEIKRQIKEETPEFCKDCHKTFYYGAIKIL